MPDPDAQAETGGVVPDPDEHLDILTSTDEALEKIRLERRKKRVNIIKQAVILGLTAIGLYVVWPSLAEVFSSGPQLATVPLWWGFPILGATIASWICNWALLRLALGAHRWVPIITSNLASTAFSRIVPGGLAAGAPIQFDMMAQAGFRPARAASSMLVFQAFSTATLLGLPIFSIVTVLFNGIPADRSLMRIGFIALVFCLSIAIGGAILVKTDRMLLFFGRLFQRLRNLLKRKGPPRTDMPVRLLEERDFIREMLGDGWWRAILYAAGNRLFDLTALLLCLLAVGAEPRASLVLLAYVVASFLALVPLTPGGLGFVEAGLTGTLGLAGIGAGDAVLATLIYRLMTFWLPLPLGAVAYVVHQRLYRRGRGGGEGRQRDHHDRRDPSGLEEDPAADGERVKPHGLGVERDDDDEGGAERAEPLTT